MRGRRHTVTWRAREAYERPADVQLAMERDGRLGVDRVGAVHGGEAQVEGASREAT